MLGAWGVVFQTPILQMRTFRVKEGGSDRASSDPALRGSEESIHTYFTIRIICLLSF